MSSAKEFAEELGIKENGNFKDNVYIVNLDNSDEYSKIYTLLSNSELLELNPEAINLGVSEAIISYDSEDYTVKLLANFDEDVYTVSIEDSKE